MDTKERPVDDKIEKPASRWRNWYVVTSDEVEFADGLWAKEGESVRGLTTWPSKDSAETWAKNNQDSPVVMGFCGHIGAFPEGQDAP